MARTRTPRGSNHGEQPVVQLSLLDLENYLTEHEGELIKLPFDPDSIGGSLVEILSNGLYTNPLACIREYVQNSVDAQAKTVTIHITGNSVNVVDDGDGMSLLEMLNAREFGLSPKLIEQHVGFRGIGIYSGYGICRKMRITSKKAGESIQHVLVFDFDAMRTMLEAAREHKEQANKNQASSAEDHAESASRSVFERVSLIKLLSEHTYIKREQSSAPLETSRTHVQLQDISEAHIKQLSNLAELKIYMLQNLPIDFADFEYKDLINEHLYRHVPGYSAVSIRLQSDGVGEEFVQKKLPSTLQRPTFGYISSADGRHVAYYWACLNSEHGRLEPNTSGNGKVPSLGTETSTYEGFVYKMKGFTVGDRTKLLSLWGAKQTLYRWYTGEIYVLDPSVKPNAERDDFETNPSQRALVWAVKHQLEELYEAAEEYQAQRVADKRIGSFVEDLEKIERKVDGNLLSPGEEFEAYTQLKNMLDEIKRQRRKASAANQQLAEDLKKRADRLQKILQKNENPRTSESTKRKRAAQIELPLPTDSNISDGVPPSAPMPEPLPLAAISRLADVLQAAEWDLEGSILTLVNLLQASFEDVLSSDSPLYRQLLTDIEYRLAAASGNE